jgi:hypothetical protein
MEFNPEEIADFLEKIHGMLDKSTLLLSTEGFDLKVNTNGSEFEEDFKFWDEYCPYNEELTLEENLQHYEMFWTSCFETK